MALRSHQLEAFVAIAKTKSFSKAAALLHVTQSALSHRISALEEEIGAPLFFTGTDRRQAVGRSRRFDPEMKDLPELLRSGLTDEVSSGTADSEQEKRAPVAKDCKHGQRGGNCDPTPLVLLVHDDGEKHQANHRTEDGAANRG